MQGQEPNRTLFIISDYSISNDTIAPEYYRKFMDTVCAFILEESDTLYYQGDLLDLNNHYLRYETPAYEDGTQKYLFRVEVVDSDFN